MYTMEFSEWYNQWKARYQPTINVATVGLATVTHIWCIYSNILQVMSLYCRHDGRADYMAVFVQFMYG